VFLTRSSHNKGPMTDWIVHFYCPKVPLSIGTTLGALGWLVLKSVFHTPGSEPPITLSVNPDHPLVMCDGPQSIDVHM
jgi:hypothetical protein